jgi:undecaprenyl phosphate-alpha-L-ara4N flippase subunit ArnE
MSKAKMISLVLLYIACGATGDLMLSYGMKAGPHVPHPWLWVLLGTSSLGIGYGIFLGLLKDVPLSVVVPAGAGSYIVIAALSRLVLHEAVPPQRWVGTVLVSFGVSLVMLSDLQTRGAHAPAPEPELEVDDEPLPTPLPEPPRERVPAGARSGAME